MKKFILKVKKSCHRFMTGKSGFSLVELIVVIAIMAVMAAVLAPALLGYVERSRAQKDDSAMGEVVNSMKLSLADQNVYDELLPYAVKGNFSCYCDGDTSTNTDANKTITKAPDYWLFTDEARKLDETPYKPAGSMRGATVTFKPNGKAEYILKAGVVNQIGDESTKKGTNGGAVLEDCPELYNRLRSTVGDTIKVSSQTYRNSTYTIFISMGTTGGNQADKQDAIQVYGQYNGTNLPEVMTATGSATQDKGNAGQNSPNNPSNPDTPTGPVEVTFKNAPINFYGSCVWTDGINTYYSSYSDQYVLKGDTWEPMHWKGLTSFRRQGIWTDGTNIYYSSTCMGDGNNGDYILRGDTWEPMTWNIGTFYVGDIYTDGTNIYRSAAATHHVLNKETGTWETKTWSGGPTHYGKVNFYGQKTWSNGSNVYISEQGTQYYLDGDTWKRKTWNGLAQPFCGHIWTDGTNIYHSAGSEHYILDEATSTWNPTTWDVEGGFYGSAVWTDGAHYYVTTTTYEYVSDEEPPIEISHHYKLF